MAAQQGTGSSQVPAGGTPSLRGLLASQVVTEHPDRFWPDKKSAMLIQGALNLIAGPSKSAKSLATVKIAADFTRTRGGVIYSNKEDVSAAQRDRLKAAGADMDKVRLAHFNIPSDLEELEWTIRTEGIGLVIFDTAVKHIEAQLRNDRAVAEALMPLAAMAERTGVIVLFVHHTLKNIPKGADPLFAIGGDVAGLVGSCRWICLFGQRPDNPAQRVLCPVADSYADPGDAVVFEFTEEEFYRESDGMAYDVAALTIAEKGVRFVDALALVKLDRGSKDGAGASSEKRAEAAEFLTKQLAMGARPVKSCDVCPTDGHVKEDPKNLGACPKCSGPISAVEGLMDVAQTEGVSWATIRRASDALQIVKGRKGAKQGSIPYWRLPDGHPALAPNAASVLP